MIRIGHGYDVHAFTGGSHVVLGGVRIRCDVAVQAHSDGDVLLHALCDALLGAAALGDIGRHFPDDDPQWRGVDSRILVARVMELVTAQGWQPVNADFTLVAERPRIAPHVEAMCANIATALDLPLNAVNIKATTHEGVGGLGRGEGLAAHAVVLLERG